MFAVSVSYDGFVEVNNFDPARSYELISGAVEGWIEATPIVFDGNQYTMWVNEEGKINGLPLNVAATALWQASNGDSDWIVGNAYITGGVDDEGESLGIPGDQACALAATAETFIALSR